MDGSGGGRYHSNLTLRVCPCRESEKLERLHARLEGRSDGAALLVSTTHAAAVETKERLLARGVMVQSLTGGAHEPDAVAMEWFRSGPSPILSISLDMLSRIEREDIRQVTACSLPASPADWLRVISEAGRDELEADCHLIACPEDRQRVAGAIQASVPDDDELAAILDRVMPSGETGDVSLRRVAGAVNVPVRAVELVVQGLVDIGALKNPERYHGVAILEPRRSSREILGRYDRERSRFLRGLFLRAHPRGDVLRLEIHRTAEAMGESPDRIRRALEHLQAQGDMELYFRDEHIRFQNGAAAEELLAAARQSLHETEQHALGELNALVEIVEHPGCRWRRLLEHFREDLGRPCGHCDWCLGARPGLLPAVAQPEGVAARACAGLQALRGEHADALLTPRRAARFLTGHATPVLQRQGLTGHKLFGSLSTWAFDSVVKRLSTGD